MSFQSEDLEKMESPEVKEISALEHQYIQAALSGTMCALSAAIITNQIQAGDVLSLAIAAGRATYKSVLTGAMAPQSVIQRGVIGN